MSSPIWRAGNESVRVRLRNLPSSLRVNRLDEGSKRIDGCRIIGLVRILVARFRGGQPFGFVA